MAEKKRNRDKLLAESMYDMLCRMNSTMTRLQDDGHRVCVLDALGVAGGYCKRPKTGCTCDQCIADWLNEFPF